MTEHPAPQLRSKRLRLLHPRYWPSWLALGVLRVLGTLPGCVRGLLAAKVIAPLLLRNSRRVQTARQNIGVCFPKLSLRERHALLKEHATMLARSLLDTPVLWWGSESRLDRMIRIEGLEHLETARATGRPILLLTGHNTSLEFGAQALARHFPMTGMIKSSHNPVFEWTMQRFRSRFMGRPCPRNMGIRQTVRLMREGCMFYYLPDEDLGSCRVENRQLTSRYCFASFFGVPTYTLCTADRIVRATDGLLVPCWSYFDVQRHCHVLKIFPAWQHFPLDDQLINATLVRSFLEDRIREYPSQYLWSQRMFRTRPE